MVDKGRSFGKLGKRGERGQESKEMVWNRRWTEEKENTKDEMKNDDDDEEKDYKNKKIELIKATQDVHQDKKEYCKVIRRTVRCVNWRIRWAC